MREKQERQTLIRDFDLFGVPIQLRMHELSHDRPSKTTYRTYNTCFGGLMTCVYLTLLLVYLIFLIIRMESGLNDITLREEV